MLRISKKKIGVFCSITPNSEQNSEFLSPSVGGFCLVVELAQGRSITNEVTLYIFVILLDIFIMNFRGEDGWR